MFENRRLQLVLEPFCQLCAIFGKKPAPACESHHIMGRRFRLADDLRNLLSVCRTCHDHVESLPGEVCYCILGKCRTEGSIDIDFLASAADINLRGKLSVWSAMLPDGLRWAMEELLSDAPAPHAHPGPDHP